MLVVDAFSSNAFKVIHIVESQERMVSQEVFPFQNEQWVAPCSQRLLKLNQRTCVLVVLTQVVQQTYHFLTVHCRLDSLISSVEGVGAKPIELEEHTLT